MNQMDFHRTPIAIDGVLRADAVITAPMEVQLSEDEFAVSSGRALNVGLEIVAEPHLNCTRIREWKTERDRHTCVAVVLDKSHRNVAIVIVKLEMEGIIALCTARVESDRRLSALTANIEAVFGPVLA